MHAVPTVNLRPLCYTRARNGGRNRRRGHHEQPMSSEFVFCPKCGAQSTASLRFCTKCGTNLEAVSRVLTGQLVPGQPAAAVPIDQATEMEIAYAREFSRAMYRLLGSLATFTVMLVVFRGQWWVFFTLFWVANCVRDLVQAALLKKRMTNPAVFHAALEAFQEEKQGKRKRRRDRDKQQLAPPPPPQAMPMPPVAYGDYLPPARTTGELPKLEPDHFEFDPANPPPSVTEGPTQLFDENREEREEYSGPPPAARERQ